MSVFILILFAILFENKYSKWMGKCIELQGIHSDDSAKPRGAYFRESVQCGQRK